MKKKLSAIGTVIVFMFTLALSFNVLTSDAWAVATGNFSQTCRNVLIRGSTLSASCERANGRFQNTSINLNPYIGNTDGKLSWDDENFSKTCRNTSLAGGTLKGECQRREDKSWTRASINLDTYITNVDGTLQFQEDY